jgi:hypothetical protein
LTGELYARRYNKVLSPRQVLDSKAAADAALLAEPGVRKVPYYTAPRTTPLTTLHVNKNRDALRQRKLRGAAGGAGGATAFHGPLLGLVPPDDHIKLICTAAFWIKPLVAPRSFFVCARKLAQKHTSIPPRAPPQPRRSDLPRKPNRFSRVRMAPTPPRYGWRQPDPVAGAGLESASLFRAGGCRTPQTQRTVWCAKRLHWPIVTRARAPTAGHFLCLRTSLFLFDGRVV